MEAAILGRRELWMCSRYNLEQGWTQRGSPGIRTGNRTAWKIAGHRNVYRAGHGWITRDRREGWTDIGDSSLTSTVTNCYLQIRDAVDRVGVLVGAVDLILARHDRGLHGC